LNLSCLQDQNAAGLEMTVEATFDYVGLEEGNDHPARVQEEEPDLDTCLSFVLSAPKKMSRNNYSLKHGYTDTLVEQWIPCGIEEGAMSPVPFNKLDNEKDIRDSLDDGSLE
jgi:hypothetical protein